MFNRRIVKFVRPMQAVDILLQWNFTAFVTALVQEGKDAQARHDDVDAWSAPSECHDLVRKSNQAAIENLLYEYGYTPSKFYRECKARGLSGRWQYENLPEIEFE